VIEADDEAGAKVDVGQFVTVDEVDYGFSG
jgi:hypothetical protein